MPHGRVRFWPAGFILEGIISFIKGTNEREKCIIIQLSGCDFLSVAVIVIADAGFVMTTVSYHENQRLTPAFCTSPHHFNHNIAFVLMDFINQCTMWSWA